MEKDIFVELNFLIMIIDDALPKFDLPVDFVTDDSITGDILNQYGRFPCHINAARNCASNLPSSIFWMLTMLSFLKPTL